MESIEKKIKDYTDCDYKDKKLRKKAEKDILKEICKVKQPNTNNSEEPILDNLKNDVESALMDLFEGMYNKRTSSFFSFIFPSSFKSAYKSAVIKPGVNSNDNQQAAYEAIRKILGYKHSRNSVLGDKDLVEGLKSAVGIETNDNATDNHTKESNKMDNDNVEDNNTKYGELYNMLLDMEKNKAKQIKENEELMKNLKNLKKTELQPDEYDLANGKKINIKNLEIKKN